MRLKLCAPQGSTCALRVSLFFILFYFFTFQNEAIYHTALGTVPFKLGFIVFSSSIAF